MNPSLLTYEQAAQSLLPMKISVRTLRRYASDAVPFRKRLKVVRFSKNLVSIRPVDLEKWKESNAT